MQLDFYCLVSRYIVSRGYAITSNNSNKQIEWKLLPFLTDSTKIKNNMILLLLFFILGYAER